MLKFKTSCAVLAYLSSNLLNEVGLSLFRYFEIGLRVCDIVVKKFTFAISSPDEFLFTYHRQRGIAPALCSCVNGDWLCQWERAIFDHPQNRHLSTDHQKFVTGDYVGDPYGCAKLGAYPSTAGVGAHG